MRQRKDGLPSKRKLGGGWIVAEALASLLQIALELLFALV